MFHRSLYTAPRGRFVEVDVLALTYLALDGEGDPNRSAAYAAVVLATLYDEYLPAHGLTFGGPHHEIYLGDPRRTGPKRLRTILRQPVRPVRVL